MAGQPPRGRPPTTTAAHSPHRACKPRGQCWAPTRAHPRPQHVGDGPRQPAQRAGSRERGSAWLQTPLTIVNAPPRGRPSAMPTARNARRQAGLVQYSTCNVLYRSDTVLYCNVLYSKFFWQSTIFSQKLCSFTLQLFSFSLHPAIACDKHDLSFLEQSHSSQNRPHP